MNFKELINEYFLKQYNHKKAIRKPENRYPKKIRFWGFIKLSGIKFKTSKSIFLSKFYVRHQGVDVLHKYLFSHFQQIFLDLTFLLRRPFHL